MKRPITCTLVLLLAFLRAAALADEPPSVELQLFTIDRSELQFPPKTDATSVFRSSPASFPFPGGTLVLDRNSFKWAPAPPASLRLIASTSIPLGPTGGATLRCIAVAQYMERLPDGNFALRQIAPDDPEVPRYVLSLQVGLHNPDGFVLDVTCHSEIAIARSRAPLEGVKILIGKPQVELFKDKLHFGCRRGEWQALLFRPPPPTETAVIALLKIQAPTPSIPNDKKAVARGARPLFNMGLAANRTEAGRAADAPTPQNPVGYLFFDGGFGDYGTPTGPTRPPDAKKLKAAWQAALASEGFKPAHANLPPKIVLIARAGLARGTTVRNIILENDFSPSRVYEASFAVITAYDYADFAAGRRTLLWRVGTTTNDQPDFRKILPLMIRASASWFGTQIGGRTAVMVDPDQQSPTPDITVPNDPEFERTIDTSNIAAVAKLESRMAPGWFGVHIFPQEREPRVPITLSASPKP